MLYANTSREHPMTSGVNAN